MAADTLGPGPKLDALVAEKVMGLVWDKTRCRVCGWPLAPSREDGCVAGDCSMRPPPRYRVDEPPPYSTDIAAAWQVVGKMREHGYRLSLRTWVQSADAMAVFVDPKREWAAEDGEITTDTASLAICRAALKALNVEIPE